MTVVFIVCIAISAVCQTAEFGWLDAQYEGCARLRISYILKLLIVILAVGTAIAMVPPLWNTTNNKGVLMALKYKSAAAVCEWVIAVCPRVTKLIVVHL